MEIIQEEENEHPISKSASNPEIINRENIFMMSNTPSAMFSKDTPSFNPKSDEKSPSEIVPLLDHGVDYDTPDRYIFEFYSNDQFDKFKKIFYKAMKKRKAEAVEREDLTLIGNHSNKYLFMELENVLFYFSQVEVPDLPLLKYFSSLEAAEINCKPFYLYLRPFTVNLLTTVCKKYNIALYSSLDRKVLEFVLEHFQNYYSYFTLCITHKQSDGPKKLEKYYNNIWNCKNSVIIDYNPETLANNFGN